MLDSMCSNSTAAVSPEPCLLTAAVESGSVGTEGLTRLLIEIDHVPAAVELQLHAAILPVPVDVARKQRVGHLCLEPELIAGVGGHGPAIGAGDDIKNWIRR